jgi:Mg2+/citrate symporter
MKQGIWTLARSAAYAAFAILFFGGAYVMWPAGFFSTPFSQMEAGSLLRAVASPVLAVIGIEFLSALAIVLLSDG